MTVDQKAGGLAADIGLYALAAGFAVLTALTSTLAPHRAWGSVAAAGYTAAALVVTGQLLARRHGVMVSCAGTGARAALTALTWVTTAWLPLVLQTAQRSGGRADRAQEEVVVVEDGGGRLLHDGSPYLSQESIAALPPDGQLLGYLPYQPGMALFGLPRAVAGDQWWTDARIWFALATLAALAGAVAVLRGPGRATVRRASRAGTATTPPPDPGLDATLVRAVQLSTVLPVCALTLATGGDDLPVLALCLLALAFSAAGRYGRAGLAIGAAAALKLFAWPVGLVLLVHAATRGRRAATRLAGGGLGLPLLALVPPLLVNPGALVHNVVVFPLGGALVSSPAQSPLPGHLIATTVPAGQAVAAALLLLAGAAIAVHLVRRPPRTVTAPALICGYGLLLGIALMPSTRFGYLLYPIALLAWVPPLRRSPPVPVAEPTPEPAGRLS